jgi:molecular chaperone GrpE
MTPPTPSKKKKLSSSSAKRGLRKDASAEISQEPTEDPETSQAETESAEGEPAPRAAADAAASPQLEPADPPARPTPAAASPPPAPGGVENLRANLARLTADFENLKKRTREERIASLLYAHETVAQALLPVLDDFDRALAPTSRSSAEQFSRGVEMIRTHLIKVLQDLGISRFDCVGQPFDPLRHQAVQVRNDPSLPPNTVVAEHQKGYLYHGKLLRTAIVVVSPARARPAVAGPKEITEEPLAPESDPPVSAPPASAGASQTIRSLSGTEDAATTLLVDPPDAATVLEKPEDWEFDHDSLDLSEVVAEEGLVEEKTNPEIVPPKKGL